MLTIVKRDNVTDEPLQGAEFRITTVQGVPVDDNEETTSSNGFYSTNAQGEITIFKLLPRTYTVTETKAPNGYAIDRTPQTVEVRENDSQTLTFRDTALQSLTIVKYEEGTTNPIAGVTFSVTDASGASIGAGTYTTDSNGQITVNGLTPGMTVVVRETRTVRGYVLNGEPQTIQISANGAAGTASGNTLVFYDSPLSTLIIHCYLDGTENEPLANVGFKVVDGSGKSIGPDDGVYYTDHAGNITLSNLEPGVTVNARIFKIPAGFVLDGLPQDIVMESGTVQELTFWAKRQGSVTVRVLDIQTREPVPGVEFSVKYADRRPVDTSNGQQSSGGQYFTDSNGEISITGVTGTIVITEENTIPGYTIDPNARTKTVTVEPNDTQTLTFFNSPKQTLVVQKYASGTTNPVAGAVFYVTDVSVNSRGVLTKEKPGSEESGWVMESTTTSRADQSLCAAGLSLHRSGAFQGSSGSIQSSPLLSIPGSSSKRKRR